VAVVALTVLVGSCGQSDQIERYQVDKPPMREKDAESPHPGMDSLAGSNAGPMAGGGGGVAEGPVRLLGAIIPRGQKYWFFKVTGPPDALAPHAESFTAFVESIRFGAGDDAEPTWTLPDGWQQEPGSGMRLASIRLEPNDPTLVMSVIPLAFFESDGDAYVLSNVNRWRRQVGLSEIDSSQLSDETTTVSLDGATAVVVDLTGGNTADAEE
jgi:hypothetical protein